MLNSQELQTPVFEIGEDIGYQLGKNMVESFQRQHPFEIPSFLVGKKILLEVLNQPGCEGVRIYNAINEAGNKTVVYVATDSTGKNIFQVTCVNEVGALSTEAAIVGDRVIPGTWPVSKPKIGEPTSPSDWEWSFD